VSNFAKPTIKDIYDTILNDYIVRTGQQIPILKRSLVKCFAYAIAGIVSFMWNFAEWQYLQVFVETCDFESLKRWGNLVNINHKKGTKAILRIKLNNIQPNITIQAGTTWKSLINGLIYKSILTTNTYPQTTTENNNQTTVNYQLSTINLNVECTEIGSKGNLPNEEILNLINPLIGIPDTATVDQTITIGTEDEDTESYRVRVITRYRNKPQGGSAMDYYQWATEVNGIIDCLPYVLTPGLITLYIIKDGIGLNRTPTGEINPNIFPQWNNGQIQDINGYGQFLSVAKSISGSNNNNTSITTNTIANYDRRPLNTKVQLLPPNYTEYKVEITELNPISEQIIQNIKEGLINELNKKRPNIKILNYTINNATINSNQLNSIVQNIMNKVDGSFTNFMLRNSNDEIILNDILSIGCLAYLGELKINGSVIDL
jgi:hypothetical protein